MDCLIMKKAMYRFSIFLAAGLACLVSLQIGTCLAGSPSMIAVLPFKINAAENLDYLKEGVRCMLVSRLSCEDKVVVIDKQKTEDTLDEITGDIDHEKAREIGGMLNADYVLFGELTLVEASITFDGMVIDVHEQKPDVVMHDQRNGMDTVIPIINEFAGRINKQLWGRTKAVRKESNSLQTPSVSDIYLHPDQLLEQGRD